MYTYVHISIYNYMYVYMYTFLYTFLYALLPIKPSSDDDSVFRQGFGAEASLPLTQSVPAVTNNTTRLC